MFKKILIANRGEIACRIIRTAKQLGIETVAIYSDADHQAKHCRMADYAYRVGPSPSRASYLNISAILDVAKTTEVDAIHPGYGFLAENPDFARACQQAGIIFIGPPIEAIEAMGSKQTAKHLLAPFHIPMIPGYHGAEQTTSRLIQEAKKIGFPLLIKAAAGGGGKGMRIVTTEDQLTTAIAAAQREGQSSFGDETLILEKYLFAPRHIEIQIFADQSGEVVHLFERDCSLQRRYQKIIEEAPAPHFSATLREKMSEAAKTISQAIHYIGAGTIEFLVADAHTFYFMEMNTRLQVEHPITEMITGIDLVAWQLQIAAGLPLPMKQNDLTIHGHAIEARIYAEDPAQQFLPSVGTIHFLQAPPLNEKLRLDQGVDEGDSISPYYDPLIAKLIVWGKDREAARQTLIEALQNFYISGVTTNLNFLQTIARHLEFSHANIHTHFLEQHQTTLPPTPPITHEVIGSTCLYWLLKQTLSHASSQSFYSPWAIHDAWQLNLPATQKFSFELEGESVTVNVTHYSSHWIVNLASGESLYLSGQLTSPTTFIAYLNDKRLDVTVKETLQGLALFGLGWHYTVHLSNQENTVTGQDAAHPHLTAPMPGTVVAVPVKVGDIVKRGENLIIIEAMKMEHTIQAPTDGMVTAIYFQAGESVNEGSTLVAMEAT